MPCDRYPVSDVPDVARGIGRRTLSLLPASADRAGSSAPEVSGKTGDVPGTGRIYAGAGCEAGAGDSQLL